MRETLERVLLSLLIGTLIGVAVGHFLANTAPGVDCTSLPGGHWGCVQTVSNGNGP